MRLEPWPDELGASPDAHTPTIDGGRMRRVAVVVSVPGGECRRLRRLLVVGVTSPRASLCP